MNAAKYGGIAQLGERLNGIQEVSGSIPLISTTGTQKTEVKASVFFCFFGDLYTKVRLFGEEYGTLTVEVSHRIGYNVRWLRTNAALLQ